MDVGDDFVVLQIGGAVWAGGEVFNNYGTEKSNESLLAAYGFAEADNPSDSVALLLQGKGDVDGKGDGRGSGLCYLGRGGLTPELWAVLLPEEEDEEDEDEGEDAETVALAALEALLHTKLQALEASELDTAPITGMDLDVLQAEIGYVRDYRAGLRAVLTGALQELNHLADLL
jgi:hypothetical protein